MPANPKLLAVILGGGAGNRLFPLTQQRSKPAVPLGGKYRLVDIALSNCINSDILRTFVLTQYNSASLNRHIAQTYRFSQFSNGRTNNRVRSAAPYHSRAISEGSITVPSGLSRSPSSDR